MEKTINKLTVIENYLSKTIQPCYTVTDKYNGMHFTDFIKKFRDIRISYPYKDDKKLFIIELHEKDSVTACEMINNVCIKSYIFENN